MVCPWIQFTDRPKRFAQCESRFTVGRKGRRSEFMKEKMQPRPSRVLNLSAHRHKSPRFGELIHLKKCGHKQHQLMALVDPMHFDIWTNPSLALWAKQSCSLEEGIMNYPKAEYVNIGFHIAHRALSMLGARKIVLCRICSRWSGDVVKSKVSLLSSRYARWLRPYNRPPKMQCSTQDPVLLKLVGARDRNLDAITYSRMTLAHMVSVVKI